MFHQQQPSIIGSYSELTAYQPPPLTSKVFFNAGFLKCCNLVDVAILTLVTMADFPNIDMERLFQSCFTGCNLEACFGDENNKLANEKGRQIVEHFGVEPHREPPTVCSRCNGKHRSMNDGARTLRWR